MRQRTFPKGRQMGAWALTLGLRAAVETRRRLQINRPDPVIPMGQEIASTSAGANPEHEVSLADARDASGHRLPGPRRLALLSLACSLRSSWRLSSWQSPGGRAL